MAVEHHERALALDLLLEWLLLRTVHALEEDGIPTRVLKGASVAHTVYPSPALRSFGDVDLLVPGSHYDRAVGALCAQGGRRRYPEPRLGFDRRFGKGVCIETRDGVEVDLHRTLVAGPFGLSIDADELFDAAATFSISDRVLDCLDLEARLIHACFRAALGGDDTRLVPLRDVAQIALHTAVDTDRVQDLVTRWRCGIVVQRAIRLTWEAFALNADPALVRWARRHEPSVFEQRAVRAYVAPNRSYARQALAGLEAVRGVPAKVAYARALMLPRASYVRERDGGYLRRLKRGVKLLVGNQAKH